MAETPFYTSVTALEQISCSLMVVSHTQLVATVQALLTNVGGISDETALERADEIVTTLGATAQAHLARHRSRPIGD